MGERPLEQVVAPVPVPQVSVCECVRACVRACTHVCTYPVFALRLHVCEIRLSVPLCRTRLLLCLTCALLRWVWLGWSSCLYHHGAGS